MATDPRGLRADAPLLDAWLRFQEQPPRPFTIPGHKQRTDLVGDVVAGDVPLYAGLDTMKLTSGVLAEAEARAARLWGADVCRFSTGGATHANQAVALAVAGEGDTVVVSRTLHRSLLIGLVLAGLTPVWVRPEVDPASGLPLGVAPETLRRALDAHPEARAVFVGDPSYVGNVRPIVLSNEDMAVFHGHYVPEGADPTDLRLSPLHAPDLSGLPPAVVVLAGMDPLHDSGVRYAQALADAGNHVRVEDFHQMPHGFLSFPYFCHGARPALDAIVRSQRAALR